MEDKLTGITFDILKINSFFVWSPKSKMFRKRYTHAWELLKNFRFPSVAILKNFHMQENKYGKDGTDLRQQWERNEIFEQINDDDVLNETTIVSQEQE